MLGLTGLFAPLVTPFTDDAESLSEIRLARLVRHLRERGVAGFVACTETGEFITTSTSERKQVLEILLREAHGLPVLAHCTRLGTAQSLDLCQHASRHGALAAVIMPPYFGVYTDDEIERHIRVIVQHAALPVIVVDPEHKVRFAVKERLDNLPDLDYGVAPERAFRTNLAVDPVGCSSDEFVIGEAVVSPLIQIDPAGVAAGSDLDVVSRLIGQYGRPRIAKAALTLRDIEVGPPRPPVLNLPQEACEELERVIQTK